MSTNTPSTRQFEIHRLEGGNAERSLDLVAVEEPLEIRIAYQFKNIQRTEIFAIAMRTPGHDRELTAGLLLSEGVVRCREDIQELRALGSVPTNEILAILAPGCDYDGAAQSRQGYINSSCGICGKRTRDTLAQQLTCAVASKASFDANLLTMLPDLLRERQAAFDVTGGLHAAALVDHDGRIEYAFEDIGRHNALDKLIGHCLLNGLLPLTDRLLLMSSRSSFELVQKALMAGASALATIGGPSSLAIETAREHGLTLAGFIRNGHFNLYSGEWRVHSKQDETSVPFR